MGSDAGLSKDFRLRPHTAPANLTGLQPVSGSPFGIGPFRLRAFLGRERELDLLNRELDRHRPSLIVLYGRRRVGKSALLARVTRNRRTFYYSNRPESPGIHPRECQLQLCDPHRSLRDNILDVVLDPGAPLGNEADNVLQAELSTPARYATILQAIATGCTTTGEILGRTREISDTRALSPYLEKLQALRLIQATRSLDAPPKARSHRFRLADPFLAFWYRFRLPNSSALAVGHTAHVYNHAVRPELHAHMGEIFEWIGREYIQWYGEEILTTAAREVGKIWGSDFDLDIAGTTLDRKQVFGECKWTSAKVGMSVLGDLAALTRKTTYGRRAAATHLVLMSRKGFTKELQRRSADTPFLHLVDPAALLGET